MLETLSNLIYKSKLTNIVKKAVIFFYAARATLRHELASLTGVITEKRCG